MAINSAVSTASVPELTKNTLAPSMVESAAIFSASSIMGRIRYSVELWSIFPA